MLRRKMRHKKPLIAVLCFFTAVLFVVAGKGAAAESSRHYVMDHDYFSCDIPNGWDLERDKDSDEEYRIYEIVLSRPAEGQLPATIGVSYYAEDNEDFTGYQNFLARNSQNAVGEMQNSREKYGPVREIRLGGGSGFELERDRLIYLFPDSRSDASAEIRELIYVLPAATGGFYVLHYSAPLDAFEGLLPIFRKVAASFRPQAPPPPPK